MSLHIFQGNSLLLNFLLSLYKDFSYCSKIIHCCRVPGSCAHWFSVMWPSWMNMDHIAKQVLPSYQCCRLCSGFFPSRIPDPGVEKAQDPGFGYPRYATLGWEKNLRTFNPKIVTKLLKLCLCRISDPGSGFFSSWIPDPEIRLNKTGSRIRIRNTASYFLTFSKPTDVFAPFCHYFFLFCTKLWEGGGERRLILSFYNPQVKTEDLIF